MRPFSGSEIHHSHDLTNGVVPEAGLLGHALWDMASSCHSINICIFASVSSIAWRSEIS